MQKTRNKPNYLTKNKLKSILDKTTFKDLSPNDQQLREWNMSKKRFTQIKLNAGVELSFTEAIQLTEWLKPFFTELQPWHLFDYPVNGKAQSNE